MSKEIATPPFVEHVLVHYTQNSTWDCGLSCIAMVLKDNERIQFLCNFAAICKEERIERSTWTIDLCYILRRFNVRHKYLTQMIGINPNHERNDYYDKILNKDSERVLDKFNKAQSMGIVIEQKTANNRLLIDHLANHGPIILLINSGLLNCDSCKTNRLSNELRTCFPFPYTPAYTGHYIVLCGYNLHSRKFLYRNPIMKDHVCMMPFDKMTDARIADGTDEDILLIFNDDVTP